MTTFYQTQRLKCLTFLAFTALSFASTAIEVTTLVGNMAAGDFKDASGQELSVDSAEHISLGIAWDDGPNGQGQVLLSAVTHDFDTNNNTQHEIDIYYAHFNGIAQFKHQNYVTTVSLGVGGAYYDVENGNNDVFPSLTAALGTKYQLDKQLTIVTELRSYMTLTDDDSDLFCPDDVCIAQFDNTLWFETAISVGLSYKF